LKVIVTSASATQGVQCGGYLIGLISCVGVCICTYVYGEGKGESKLHVLCSCLSTRPIIFDDQSGPD